MIKIEALIRPQKLEEVKQALRGIGVRGMTISDVRGTGQERGFTQHYRGSEYTVNLLHKIKVEVVVVAKEARVVAKAIADAAYTGEVGDGKIYLLPIHEVIRIRTEEEGEAAIS